MQPRFTGMARGKLNYEIFYEYIYIYREKGKEKKRNNDEYISYRNHIAQAWMFLSRLILFDVTLTLLTDKEDTKHERYFTLLYQKGKYRGFRPGLSSRPGVEINSRGGMGESIIATRASLTSARARSRPYNANIFLMRDSKC